VCGGGRYDGLVEECGGPSVPGVGFGLGLERLLLVLESQNIEIPKPGVCDVYFATIGEKARVKAFELVQLLREKGVSSDMDHVGRSLKAQFKYADKLGARFVGTLGDDELTSGQLRLKEMATGSEETVAFDESFDYLETKVYIQWCMIK
jgi:histidyl-tRNA synthetase